MPQQPPPQRIALVAFPGIRAFDVAVITEVWGIDRTDRGAPAFELRRCGPDARPVAMPGGLTLVTDRDLEWLENADLVVVPGVDDHLAAVPEAVLTALRRAHEVGTPVASLCGGAFVLAQAGLLDGRRAVTHWNLTTLLAAAHPSVDVVADALFVEDGGIWTAAGVAAGIDLCLHLVRTAHGAEAAATIARAMVTAPFRTGTQAQFIEHPATAARVSRAAGGASDLSTSTSHVLAAVREQALRRLSEPLSVADLARWAGMSPRSFARHFTAGTGTTPIRWLLDQRIAAAQQLLERTALPMPEIARRCGFGSEVTMRQHFAARLATSPRDYRRAFRAAG
ncbi:AraC family transcriptional regulator [Streptomyces mashuensis]|uniref:AraC family transcriptional regulator n=1 Tax=Streptomyces mashuensis TaxID=33904 RepID=A0A919BAZ2_9ACTN|nr:AraC family transcriptional regulator [Streptomyces mashuensis]